MCDPQEKGEIEEQKTKWKIENSKMADLSVYTSKITLYINDLDSPIKRDIGRMKHWATYTLL